MNHTHLNHRQIFESELLERSVSSDIETAILEWRTLHHKRHKEPQFCICGQHVKHVIPIFNIHNHQFFTVGHTCANKHNIKQHLSNETLFLFLNTLLDDPESLETKRASLEVHLIEFINQQHHTLKTQMVESKEMNYFDIVLPFCKLNENVDELINKFHFDLVEIHNLIIRDVYFMNEKIKQLENQDTVSKKKSKKKRAHKKKKENETIELETLENPVVNVSNQEVLETFFESPVQITTDMSDNNEILKSVLESILEKIDNPEYLEEIENPEILEDGSQILESETVSENTTENIQTETLEEIENLENLEDGSQILESETVSENTTENIQTETLGEIENIENLEDGSQILDSETVLENTEIILTESKIEYLTSDSSGEIENDDTLEVSNKKEIEENRYLSSSYEFKTPIGIEIGIGIGRLQSKLERLKSDIREFSISVQKARDEHRKRIHEIRLRKYR